MPLFTPSVDVFFSVVFGTGVCISVIVVGTAIFLFVDNGFGFYFGFGFEGCD